MKLMTVARMLWSRRRTCLLAVGLILLSTACKTLPGAKVADRRLVKFELTSTEIGDITYTFNYDGDSISKIIGSGKDAEGKTYKNSFTFINGKTIDGMIYDGGNLTEEFKFVKKNDIDLQLELTVSHADGTSEKKAFGIRFDYRPLISLSEALIPDFTDYSLFIGLAYSSGRIKSTFVIFPDLGQKEKPTSDNWSTSYIKDMKPIGSSVMRKQKDTETWDVFLNSYSLKDPYFKIVETYAEGKSNFDFLIGESPIPR
jgi:hypothetical protein